MRRAPDWIASMLPPSRYAPAALAVVAALALQLAAGRALGPSSPLLIFSLAILAASRAGGLLPGLAATAILAGCLFNSPADAVTLAVIGAAFGFSFEHLRRSAPDNRHPGAASGSLVWTCRPDGHWDHVSPRWVEFTGAGAAAHLGFGWLNQVHPEDRDAAANGWTCAVAAGRPYSCQLRIRCADGSYRWLEARTMPIHDAAGHIVKWFGAAGGVQLERPVRDHPVPREDTLAEIAAAAPAVIYTFLQRPGGSVAFPYSSPVIEEFFGLPPAGLTEDAEVAFTLIHPGDIARVRASIARSAQTMEPWRDDFRVLSPRRGEIWVEGFSTPKRQPGGGILWHGLLTDITARKRTEQDLRTASERLRLALAAGALGAFEYDAAVGCVVHSAAGPTLPFLTGVQSAPESLALVHPDDRSRVQEAMRAVLDSGSPCAFECRLVSPSGTGYWIAVRAVSVGGVRVCGVVEDITARRETERQRHLHELLVGHSRDIVLFFRYSDRRVIEVNNAALEAYGYSRAEFLNLTIDDLRPSEPRHRIDSQMARSATSGAFFEAQHHRKDGSTFLAEVSSRGAVVGGEQVLMSIVRDITARRRAEIDHHDSRVRTQLALDAARMGSWELDLSTHVLTASPRVQELFDVVEPSSPASWLERIHPDDRAHVGASIRAAAAGASRYDVELRSVARDGTVRWIQSLGALAPSGGGSPRIIGVAFDIGARKRAEQSLRESQQRLSLAHEAARSGAWEWDLATNSNIWSAEIWPLFGLAPNSCAPSYEAWLATVHPDDRAHTVQAVQKAVQDLAELNAEWRVLDPGGAGRWLMSRGRPVLDEHGRAARFAGIVMDITDRKRSETALLAANQELAVIYASAPVMLIVIGQDLRIRKMNREATRFAGAPASDLVGLRPGSALRCLNSLADPRGCGHGPDCGPCAIRATAFDTIRHSIPHRNVEVRLPSQDGETCLLVSSSPLHHNGTTEILVSIQDITLLKHAEAELARRAELIDLSHDAIVTLDAAGAITGWNAGAAEIYGWSSTEVLGRTAAEMLHSHHAAGAAGGIDELLSCNGRWDGELVDTRRDGSRLIVDSRRVLVRDAAGAPHAILQINRDITARKLAEDTARKAVEERERYLAELEAVFDNVAEGLVVLDLDGNLRYINAAGTRILGFASPDDVPRSPDAYAAMFELGTSSGGGLPADRWPFARAMRGETVRDAEVHIRRRDVAFERIVNIGSSLARDPQGNPLMLVVSLDDVTDARATRAALQRQQELFRHIAENTVETISLKDRHGRYLYLNPAGLRFLGKDIGQAIGRLSDEVFDDRAAGALLDESDRQAMRQTGPSEVELEVQTASGRRTYVSTRSPWLDDRGQVIGLIGISRDITDRKQAEQYLRNAVALKDTLLREVHHRVKNNLQMICSLMRLQLNTVGDESLKQLFARTESRILCLADVHNLLCYGTGDGHVDLARHIRSTAQHGTAPAAIAFAFRTAPVLATMDTAIPCGLIVNELVTNAVRHAFKDGRPGTITVVLERTGAGLLLGVEDDGLGFTPPAPDAATGSLGLRLVSILARQLGGAVVFEPGPGTRCHVRFPASQ